MKRLCCLILTLLLLAGCAQARSGAPSALEVYRLLQDGEWDAVYALFDQTMRSVIQVKDLPSLLPSLESSLGKPLGTGEEEQNDAPPYVVTQLPLHYEKGSVMFQVIWQDGLISGLRYAPLTAEAAPEEPADETAGNFTEEEIQLGKPALPGTLTLPPGISSPLPAVVLVHGSGPNDRDESVGNTKLFRDLAHGLAACGIAVLRYDKRTLVYGRHYNAEDLKTFTVEEETILDAAAAARLLQADPRIDPNQIYLAGHSMGAMVAPRTAAEHPGLFAGIVLLSGTPKTLADIILNQNQALVDAQPAIVQAAGKLQLAALWTEWDRIRQGSAENAAGKTLFGQPAYYFWEMAQHDTGEILASLSLPTLIINGGSDFQVPDADGIDAWRALDLPDTVHLIHKEALNHLLMAPDAPEGVKDTVQEYEIPCRIDETILEEIAAFILH